MENTTDDYKCNILIIGAGLSGLTSALSLSEKETGLSVNIMEATQTIGGQMRSSSLGEIGAKWITEDQCHIYRLLRRLNVPISKRNSVAVRLKRCWEIDKGIFSSLVKYELERYIGELEVNIGKSKAGSKKSFSDLPMLSHIEKRLFFSASRKYMTNLVLLISGIQAQSISYDDFMGICYTCGGLRNLIDLLYSVPNGLLEFSSRNLINEILTRLQNTKILYGRKICELFQYRDQVMVRDTQNVSYTAEVVILALPWNKVQDIKFSPPLPRELQKIPTEVDIPKRVITSFLAKYKEAHWRSKGYTGQCLSLEPFLVAHEYRDATMCGQLIHKEGLEQTAHSIILHKLTECFGDEMLMPIEFFQHPFEMIALEHAPLTTAWHRVIWSSSDAAGTCFRGHLGGAVQSGYRAAINALLITRPQVVVLQDISEVQCLDYLPRSSPSWFCRLFSSWNLYNVSSYTAFICGLIVVLRCVVKKH
ncbi:amine oxidase [flavin-containing] isoform X2 [Stomoxys calcitrans]|uniref:amine oxidase [flavin-containing] isoform X2 n=1 Tax=Stomoxys calcitrans TaxID=35570 RepID=UPI0027E35EB6|nr:amine oxidase [flavin-containing] isoform X2 [Stomoxys calcitrans]